MKQRGTSKRRFKPSHYNLRVLDSKPSRSKAIINATSKAIDAAEKVFVETIQTRDRDLIDPFHRMNLLYAAVCILIDGRYKVSLNDVKIALRFLQKYRELNEYWIKMSMTDRQKEIAEA